MTSHYRHQRTSNPATPFPSPIEPGEIAVNTANRQIAVGDANSGSLGNPLLLIGVRFFDVRAQYAIGDFVINAGVLYRAKVAISPGAFNATNWAVYLDQSQAVDTAGDTMTGPLVLSGDPTAPMGAATKQYTDAGDAAVTAAFTAADASAVSNANNAYVAKAGSTMTGLLTLSGNPTANLHASTKQYVDSRPALLISDNAPAGAVDNAMWWESDTGTLYVRYNDGNTTQWVTAFAVPDSSAYALNSTVVRYDISQSLTAPQQQQARQNIYAAPFDAMAYSGMQINGGMDVSQELGTAAVAPVQGQLKYIVDGWAMYFNGVTAAMQGAQVASSNIPGLSSFIYVRANTGGPFSAAGDFVTIQQSIEGYRIAKLGWGVASASPITITFWIQATIPGTFALTIQNSATNRSYVADVAINVANTWEYKTVTIPGETSGVWSKDNTIGLYLEFNFSVGSSLRAPAANVWQSANYRGSAATTNFFGANNQQVALTGVIVLPGNQGPTAAQSPNIMRPYDQELVTCQRYWQSFQHIMFTAYSAGVSTGYGTVTFRPMRAAPTATAFSASLSGCSALSFLTYQNCVVAYVTTAGGQQAIWDSGLILDARL